MIKALPSSLLNEYFALLKPLVVALEDPLTLERLLEHLGTNTKSLNGPILLDGLHSLRGALQQLQTLRDTPSLSLDAVEIGLRALHEAIAAARALGKTPAATYPDLGVDLIELLMVSYFRLRSPLTYQLAVMFGLIEIRILPALDRDGDVFRVPIPAEHFVFEHLTGLFRNPVGILCAQLPEQPLATVASANETADVLITRIGGVLTALGLPWVYGFPPEDAEYLGEAAAYMDHALMLYLPESLVGESRAGFCLALSSIDRDDLGLVVTPFGELNFKRQIQNWGIEMGLTAGVKAFAFGGGQGFTLLAGPNITQIQASFRAIRDTTEQGPALLIGADEGTRLEVGALQFLADLRLAKGENSIEMALNAQSGALVLAPGDGDGFLGSILPANGMRANFDLGLGWSSERGLTLRGSAGLDATLPVGLAIGTLRIPTIHLGLHANDAGLQSEVSASLRLHLGPVEAAIERVGLESALTFSETGGNLGVADLDLHFKSPSGVGLSINAAIVHGGGFLSFDPQQAQYTGAIHLELQGGIAVNALGLISTRLPDGQKGFSLFVVVTAEGFKPLPLGFGFMLTGIGGLLGIHRTAAIEAVQAGVEAHTLDALLSPNDPVRNAPQYLSALSAVFPPAQDHHLFGPIVHITWGTPALVTIRLALILELGVRTRFLMFGRLSAILPKRDLDLVRLEMQVAGGIDFDQHSAFLDAVLLPDSRLLHQFVITGEMRMRMSWGRQPYFVLAIGGLHHDFIPPPGLEHLKQMPRLAMILADSDDLKFRCEAYFAITSNTVQFGARVQLFARKWNFSIEGVAGFDVLIQFDPFHFVASLDASLQLKYGATNLFQVKFTGKLSGPRPLYVSGKATFKIWIFKKSVSFDRTLVEGAGPPLPAATDVAALLRHALLQPTSWSATIPGRGDRQVSLRETTGTGLLRVHPLSVLALKQNVVPLNVRITKYGTTPVAGGPQEFRIDGVEVGSHPMSIEPIRDHFAPAQFRDMSDEEKLSSRSFELLEAGVQMAASQPDCGTAVVAKVEYEDIIIPKPIPPHDPVPVPPRSGMKAAFAARMARWSAAGLSPARRRGANPYRGPAIPLPSRPKLFRVISKQDLTTVGEGQTFATRAEASDALRSIRLKKKAGFQIVRDM